MKKKNRSGFPPPNLNGDYRGACVVCMRGTDTALVFRGEAEWVIAGLINLGVPRDQACGTLSDATGCEPGQVPAGELTIPVRVCSRCVSVSGVPGMRTGVWHEGAALPVYGPRPGAR